MRITVLTVSIILLFSSCSKNDPNIDSGRKVIPWEFDITIGSYRSHFKADTNNISDVNCCELHQLIGFDQGNMELTVRGLSKLDKDYANGDVLSTGWVFPEGVGVKYPIKYPRDNQFSINEKDFPLGKIESNDTNFHINIIDLGEPWILNKRGKWSAGKAGIAEIPKQTINCIMYRLDPLGVPFDTTLEVSGKITFGWLKGD